MRSLIVRIIATMAGFYVASVLIGGFHIEHTVVAYALTSVVFVVFNLIVSPIVKLLLLPINLLTLGLFRWLTQVIVLYVFDLLYTGVSITAYNFGGYNSTYLSLPPAHLALFWVLILSALAMSLTYGVITSLLKSE